MGEIYGENLWGKFTEKFPGKISGKNSWRKFPGKISGENLWGKFAGKISGENFNL